MNLFKLWMGLHIPLAVVWFTIITVAMSLESEFGMFIAFGYGIGFLLWLIVPFIVYLVMSLLEHSDDGAEK